MSLGFRAIENQSSSLLFSTTFACYRFVCTAVIGLVMVREHEGTQLPLY